MGQNELIKKVFIPNVDKWLSIEQIKETYKGFRYLPLRRLIHKGIVKEKLTAKGNTEYMLPSENVDW